MGDLEGHASFGGHRFRLESVVEYVGGGQDIVLCRSESGELRFAPLPEWERAAVSDSGDASASQQVADAPVTQASSLDEKVDLILSLFRGRSDVYAQAFEGRSTKAGKLSYWPPCSQRWNRDVCPRVKNPKARCAECDHPSYEPLTREKVRAHCLGRRDARGRIQAIGIYVVDGDQCHFLVVDFDGSGWQDAAAAYRDACRAHGLSPAVERSRSGNGAHVWVFFAISTSAVLARRVGEGLLSEARDACAAVSFRSYDRLFPLQDSVADGSLGSLIALPLQGEAVRQGNSVFVDDAFQPLPDQCAFLSTIPKADASLIESLAEKFGCDPLDLPAAASKSLRAQTRNAREKSEQPRPTALTPARVRVTLSDGVRIDCTDLPPRLINRLRRLAAFKNPEFSKKLRMHYSVWNVPRVIDMGIMDGYDLVLPRGCAEMVTSTLRDAGISPSVVDSRTKGTHIEACFSGELREPQQACHDRLVAHDLGVLVAPTGFGKSVIAASVIATHQVNTLIIVPNTTLLQQWRASLTHFLDIDEEPPVLLTPTGRKAKHQPGCVGIIGGGAHLRSGIVDVALAGSLFERGDVARDSVVSSFIADYGMVIVDEAHRVAASQVLEVLSAVRARRVYAMTATPKRSDGLDRILFLECGPLRHEVAVADQMAEQGMSRLLIPRLCPSRPKAGERSTWHELLDYVCANEERNGRIVADAARALRHGRTPLVLTRRIEHARTLAEGIAAKTRGLGAKVITLVGGDGDSQRRQSLGELAEVANDERLCVVATGNYVGEGFDLDRLDTLLLAGPVAFEGTLDQWVGRLHRTREGKADVVVMDYVDPEIPMFERQWRSRLKEYGRLGYQMAEKSEDLDLVGLEAKTAAMGHFFRGASIMSAIDADVADATSRIAISSSWAKLSRVKALCASLGPVVGRGVSIDVVIREPRKPSREWGQVLDALRERGCGVRAARDEDPLDLVVFDDEVVWYGTCAPLGYPRADAAAIRFVGRDVAADLLGILDAAEG